MKRLPAVGHSKHKNGVRMRICMHVCVRWRARARVNVRMYAHLFDVILFVLMSLCTTTVDKNFIFWRIKFMIVE